MSKAGKDADAGVVVGFESDSRFAVPVDSGRRLLSNRCQGATAGMHI